MSNDKMSDRDKKHAMRSAHERLERESRDESGMTSLAPEERHLTCALLAWHHLGHKHVDSLCKFIEENGNKPVRSASENLANSENIENDNNTYVSVKSTSSAELKRLENINDIDSTSIDTYTLMGPVVKLPVETKMVMRLENSPCSRHNAKKPLKTQNDVTSKIDAACCMDTVCIQRLAELDTAVNELRTRAAKLARRETERVELLERAEAAWKDLELGYQKRLSLAEEKEDDMAKQIKKTIEERNSYKNICTNLAGALKERGDAAAKERDRLKSLEKEVCDRGCVRLRFSQESAKEDAALAELLCRTTQLDRDLQFKEEQARRKVLNIESEVESTQCLTLEVERAMRVELSALKEQVTEVSKKLLAEEEDNSSIKAELKQFLHEKADIIEDLDGCKVTCDHRMQGRIDELNQKIKQLQMLREKVFECRCKLPLDVSVEVKRTPSLAALCSCTPEEKLLESCSCTSLRSQLLSNLLADLFGGLQAELDGSGSLMPCSLLLCLDDRHKWDRATPVKTNLHNFFAQLLIGELDVAIATSIEKYHAKWVGASCADQAKLTPHSGEDENEGWEQRAIEHRAQKLATQLAEKLFEERAEKLTRKAREIVSGGPPPCRCKEQQPAIYSCLVNSPITNTTRKNNDVAPSYMKRTMQDVTQLKLQIQDLKKETLKREDLRKMEEKIAKLVQRSSKYDNSATTSRNVKHIKNNQDTNAKSKARDRNNTKNIGVATFIKRKEYDNNNCTKCTKKSSNTAAGRIEKSSNKMYKRLEQAFAVNLCLCCGQEAQNKVTKAIKGKEKLNQLWKQKKTKDIITRIPSVEHLKSINNLAINNQNNCKSQTKTLCPNDCVCFHKTPSNTSVDKLLEILVKWNSNLNKVVADTKIYGAKKENEEDTAKNLLLMPEFVGSGNTKTKNNLPSNIVDLTTVSYRASNEVYNIDTYLSAATESKYIGTINLDKSNYDICTCPTNIMKTEYGGNHNTPINISLHDVNAHVCKSAVYVNNDLEELGIYKYVPSHIQKIPQMYSVKVENPQFSNTETETDNFNRNISKNNITINGHSFIQDVVRKSQLFPKNCDCCLKFLGVTLINKNSAKKLKKIYHDSKAFKQSYLTNNKDKNVIKEVLLKVNENHRNSSISCCSLDCVNKDILDNLSCPNQQNKISNEILHKKEEVCVCCLNQKVSNDLELNAFNLLEEHLKGRLVQFQRSSCIPPEEENKLYSTILVKVKEIISENTKCFGCKCCDINGKGASWSRAYGMLQEYLKVKIKRVQCSCTESEGDVESILPPILEKVCDLIENDFQRLKEKYKRGDDDKQNRNKLKNEIKLTKIPFSINEMCKRSLTYTDNKDERCAKSDQSVIIQIGSCTPVDKSCEIIYMVDKDLITTEKKISCEFQIYGNDCACQHTFTEPPHLDKKINVNRYTKLISMNDNNVNSSLSGAGANSSTINSLYLKELVASKESSKEGWRMNKESLVDYAETKPETEANIPYIGYTLSCKSLVHSDVTKIDNIWKSFNDETCSKKCSYIMHKVFTNETSEMKRNINDDITNSCLNNLQPMNRDRKSIYDIEINTFDNDEDIILKHSNENCNKTMNNMTTFDEISVDTKHTNNDESSCWYEYGPQKLSDNYHIDKTSHKKILYGSLHLPATDNCTKLVETSNFIDIDDKQQLESKQCDCKTVPICHVKMLVKNIEKNLVQLQCTCDLLNSRVCPVHSKGEFYVH